MSHKNNQAEYISDPPKKFIGVGKNRKRGFDKDETLVNLIIRKKEQEIILQNKDVIDQMTRVLEFQEKLFNLSVSVSKNTDLDNALKNTFQENFLEIAKQSHVMVCSVKRRKTTSEI